MSSEEAPLNWPAIVSSSIQHELNNVLGTARLMIMERVEDGDHDLAPVVVNLERAMGLTTGLLTNWSGPDVAAGPTTEPVDLLATLSAAARNAAVTRGTPPVSIESTVPAPVVQAEPQLLLTMMTNILDNALRATPQGRGAPRIKVNQEADSHVAVDVVDYGGGIDPSLVESLFRRPITFRRTREDAGSGIGLFIARTILNEWDGSIEVRSSTSEGTVIRVCLRVAQSPHTDNAAGSSERGHRDVEVQPPTEIEPGRTAGLKGSCGR